MAANGTASRTLKPGIYAPIPTFFHPDTEDLDLSSFKAQVVRVAKAGVGPLLTGSLGEAHHLTHPERTTLIRAARQALDQEGLHHVPIIAGTGVGSTRETIDITLQAAEAGADAAIVIASGYFAGVLAGNKKALKGFWGEVSEKSPIPILMYNFPGSSGGIDLDSELITELATEYPNLVGIKLTCGSVGKLTRICATVTDTAFVAEHPRKGTSEPFLVLGGYADFLVPSTYANGHGAITGLANVAPYTLAKLFQLAETSIKEPALLAEAQQLQGIVARADYVIAKASIAGTKALLERLYGYGGHPRRPLPPIEPSAAQALWDHPDTQASGSFFGCNLYVFVLALSYELRCQGHRRKVTSIQIALGRDQMNVGKRGSVWGKRNVGRIAQTGGGPGDFNILRREVDEKESRDQSAGLILCQGHHG